MLPGHRPRTQRRCADVVGVFSDQYDDIAGDLYGLAGYTYGDYGYGLEGFDPLAQWSLYGNVDGARARRWFQPALRGDRRQVGERLPER